MAAFDLAVSRDHAVAGRVALVHVEIEGAVDAQPVDLHKGARVEQDVDAFAGGELSRLVLFLDAVFARDYPIVSGVFLIVGVGILLINLAVDLAYGYLDPRVRNG